MNIYMNHEHMSKNSRRKIGGYQGTANEVRLNDATTNTLPRKLSITKSHLIETFLKVLYNFIFPLKIFTT